MAYAVLDGRNICVGLSAVGSAVATALDVGKLWNGSAFVVSPYLAGQAEINQYASASALPSAADFGVGVAQIGGQSYVSDGADWVGNLPIIKNDPAYADRNANLLQRAFNKKGDFFIADPGIYYIGNGPIADTFANLYIDSDTTLTVGLGVTLKQTIASKSLIINKNWQSVSAAISTATYDYETPATGTTTQTVTTSTAHGLLVGDYAYIKGDTAEQINGIFQVYSVTSSTVFTILRYGARAGTPFLAISGSPIVYKANANIKLTGDGKIDFAWLGAAKTYPSSGYGSYNSAAYGNSNHGIILNKVGDVTVDLLLTNSSKYGLYLCNYYRTYFAQKNAKSSSSAVQYVGPGYDATVYDFSGESTDDPIPFVTTNSGYSAYDLVDLGGVKNSDGEFKGIKIINSGADSYSTRGVILAAGVNAPISDVYIDKLVNRGAQAKSSFLLLGVPDGQTSYIKNLSIGAVVFDSNSSVATAPIILIESGAAATLDVDMTISSINVKNVLGTVIKLGSKSGKVRLHVDSVVGSLDVTSTQVNVIEASGAGPHNVTVGTIDVEWAGTANPGVGVYLNSTNASKAQVGNIIMKTAVNTQMVGVMTNAVDSHQFQVDNINLTAPNGGPGEFLRCKSASSFQFGNCIYNGDNARGLFMFEPATAKICTLHVDNFISSATYNLRLDKTTLRLKVGGGRLSANNFVSTNINTSSIILDGDIAGYGIHLDCDADLNTTVASHAAGAKFYNKKAGSVVAPFAAGGQGVYIRGGAIAAETWAKLA